MDFSKYKYDQEKKERRIRRHQHVQQLKQIRLMPHIGEGDYQIKLKQVVGFLTRKDKVKINMFFRGREITHRELGQAILDRIVSDTATYGLPEKNPILEGRVMSVVITPSNEKPEKQAKEPEESLRDS